MRLVSLLQPVSEPELNGIAEIRVAETLGARERMARSLLSDTLWRLGLLALAALMLVWLAVSAALRPLARLSEAVQERAPDDLRPLPLVDVQRELKPLVRALNGFTERLRGQLERQARFIADASHELRTPLAALKARIELGLREPQPEVWRNTLEEAGQSTDKVIHLANQLLSWRASKAAHSPSPRAARSAWTCRSWPASWAWRWPRWRISAGWPWRSKPNSRYG